ncbi:serine hydrolase domain-containing protein [Kordiimonas sp.]|uniref:serine hydrolase domain-containing protein n=1 Tax=Kordiimonas sp. TaxID=1970157 RepID=UPI003A8C9C06
MTLFRLIAIITVSLIGQSTFAQTPPREQTFLDRDALTRFLDDAESKGFKGVVAISGPDSTIYARGFSSAGPDGTAYSAETVVDIASITKQFTGAAVMTLVEAGRLSLDDSLDKFFPDIPNDKAAITLHQLLTHTAGLPHNVGEDKEAIDKQSYLARAFSAPLIHVAGERYEYSNVGFTFAAAIIEEVTGQPYEDYLFEALWKPAGMFTTGYMRPQWNGRTMQTPAAPVEGFRTPLELMEKSGGGFWHLVGNGGILSTAEDMLKWHRALLGNTILSAKSKALLFAPHVPEDEDGVYHYGYGWSIVPDYLGEKLVWHNGGSYFATADFWRFPSQGTAFFIASHEGDIPTYMVADGLAAILLGKTPRPVSKPATE